MGDSRCRCRKTLDGHSAVELREVLATIVADRIGYVIDSRRPLGHAATVKWDDPRSAIGRNNSALLDALSVRRHPGRVEAPVVITWSAPCLMVAFR